MTLKRYQPARKRKRKRAKKNRPLRLMVFALGVVGVAAGATYVATHGEQVLGLLNGAVDFPEAWQSLPVKEAAAPAGDPRELPVLAASPRPVLAASARPAPAKLSKLQAVSPSPVATPALVIAKASPKPSSFPEGPQAASAMPASSAPLKAVVVATVAPTPTPLALKSAVPLRMSPSPTAPVKPAAKPSAAAPVLQQAVAAATGTESRSSLYFDKNSSYLAGAELARLKRLAASLKARGGTVHISGFADAKGDAKYNHWMAERRASRVADLIRQETAGKVRVVVDGVGTLPHEDEGKSRRVELEIK